MYLFGTLYIVNSGLLFPPKEITSSLSERPINAETALEDFLVVGPAVSCHVDQCGPLWTSGVLPCHAMSCHVQIGSLTAINAEMMGTKVLTLTVFQIIVSLDHNLGQKNAKTMEQKLIS